MSLKNIDVIEEGLIQGIVCDYETWPKDMNGHLILKKELLERICDYFEAYKITLTEATLYHAIQIMKDAWEAGNNGEKYPLYRNPPVTYSQRVMRRIKERKYEEMCEQATQNIKDSMLEYMLR